MEAKVQVETAKKKRNLVPRVRCLTGPPCLATVGKDALALMCQDGEDLDGPPPTQEEREGLGEGLCEGGPGCEGSNQDVN